MYWRDFIDVVVGCGCLVGNKRVGSSNFGKDFSLLCMFGSCCIAALFVVYVQVLMLHRTNFFSS